MVALLSTPLARRMLATSMESNSSAGNVSVMLTAGADVALVLLAFALALVLPPKAGRPVAISVEGLHRHHLHPHHHHHQPPLMVALLSIPPERRMLATRMESSSSVVNASVMLTAGVDVALVLLAFALGPVRPPKTERLVAISYPSVPLV